MAYGGEPAEEPTDEVRLLMGDTSASPFLSDDEVDYLLATYQLPIRAAYQGALLILTKLTGRGRIAIGTAEKDFGEIAERYEKIAESLKARGGAMGSETWKLGAPYAGGLRTDDNPLLADFNWAGTLDEDTAAGTTP